MNRLTLLVLLATLAPGCHNARDTDPDGGGPTETGTNDPAPAPRIALDYDYRGLRLGQALELRGEASCAGSWAPCSYEWALGNGQTATGLTPGKVSFTKVGFYLPTLTAVSARGTRHSAQAHLAAWDGTFRDDFNRPALDLDQRGWRKPDEETKWTLEQDRLTCETALHRPGSSSLTAWPEARDVRVEVTVRRNPDPTFDRWTDVILRLHPTKRSRSFYRVRLWEETAPNNGIELAVFKIEETSETQHGVLISDPTQAWSTKAERCKSCAYREGYPRGEDIRVVVSLVGSEFELSASSPTQPSTPGLTQKFKDPSPAPHLYAGHVGLALFEGKAQFDDFSYRSLDP
ncbi:MAG: PKD domain-containing protein [Deltaproteobacteria bacterium]|nr:PKD domain-containing protein [Deltaproteobacteria bacterium]